MERVTIYLMVEYLGKSLERWRLKEANQTRLNSTLPNQPSCRPSGEADASAFREASTKFLDDFLGRILRGLGDSSAFANSGFSSTSVNFLALPGTSGNPFRDSATREYFSSLSGGLPILSSCQTCEPNCALIVSYLLFLRNSKMARMFLSVMQVFLGKDGLRLSLHQTISRYSHTGVEDRS